MKSELLKRFFRAIASNDQDAIDKLTYLVIEDERSKGHKLLASQLENITKKNQKDKSALENGSSIQKKSDLSNFSSSALETLNELSTSKRFNTPLVTFIPREKLKHYMILPQKVEKRFQRIEAYFRCIVFIVFC
jgi:hypothetical protein